MEVVVGLGLSRLVQLSVSLGYPKIHNCTFLLHDVMRQSATLRLIAFKKPNSLPQSKPVISTNL